MRSSFLFVGYFMFLAVSGQNETSRLSDIPIYKHSHFSKIGFKNYFLNEMELYQKQAISLPIYPSLKKSDQMKIIKEIKKCFNN